MPRKNRRGGRPQARRKADGTRGQAGATAPPVSSLVVPVGRCWRNPRKPKLQFTQSEAQRALKQAQAKRERTHASRTEQRTYECLPTEGGCGYWHLTGATEYKPRAKTT